MTSRRAARYLLTAMLVSVAGALLASADSAWIEIRGPHVTVQSTAVESRARSTVADLEQFRAGLAAALPWALVPTRPTLVLLARDVAAMKTLAPQYWTPGSTVHPDAIPLRGSGRNIIALRADLDSSREAFLAYSELAVIPELPLWLTTGLSQVLSNAVVTSQGIEIGHPIAGYIAALQKGKPWRLDYLMALRRDSPEYQDRASRDLFLQQSWGLTQFLLFSRARAGEVPGKLAGEIAQLLLDGKTSTAAVQQVWGSVNEIETTYLSYLAAHDTNATSSFPVPVKPSENLDASKFALETMTAAEAAASRAALFEAMNRPVDARAALADAAKDPGLAATFEVEGRLLDREQKAEARQTYQRAVDLNSTDPWPYFRLANFMLSPTADAQSLAASQKLLARSIELDPDNGMYWNTLSIALFRSNQPANALGASRRAVSLNSRFGPFRFQLAATLERLSQKDEALKEARAALALAMTAQARAAAQAMIDRLAPGSGPAAGGAGNTPPPAGIPGGVMGGIAGGFPSAPPPPPPPPPSAPLRMTRDIQAPKKIHDVPPVYPAIARNAKAQGVVILEVTISTDGRVTDVKVLRSPPLLDQAAMDAVRQWRYEPAMRNGVPVAVIITTTVSFALQ